MMVITEVRKRLGQVNSHDEEVKSLKKEDKYYSGLGLLLLGLTFSGVLVVPLLGGGGEEALLMTRASGIAFIGIGLLSMKTRSRLARLEKADWV